ncbi:MAG: DedA family protein [Anaerotignum sp.]|nr:DedA family protein [Anaerotignum sp.]
MDFLNALKQIIFRLGYGGVFVTTALEYGCFPVSSEILLPFIGYVTSQNQQSLLFTILFATAGGVLGSVGCYSIGRIGGRCLERLAGRFRTIRLGIRRAQAVFRKYGGASVFFARLFPIARTYISFPAGMAKMPFLPFCVYTALGAFLWNTALISGGYFLGSHWESAKSILGQHKMLFWVLLVLLLPVLIFKKRRD